MFAYSSYFKSFSSKNIFFETLSKRDIFRRTGRGINLNFLAPPYGVIFLNPNLIFEYNEAQILFGMFQGFKKITLYGGARKLRLILFPVRQICLLGPKLG